MQNTEKQDYSGSVAFYDTRPVNNMGFPTMPPGPHGTGHFAQDILPIWWPNQQCQALKEGGWSST